MGKWIFVFIVLAGGYWAITQAGITSVSDFKQYIPEPDHSDIEDLVRRHANAWEVYDEAAFISTISEDILFAYPGRRLDYDALLEDYRAFHEAFEDTKVYIHSIIVDGEDIAVEWQFASTEKETGKRTSVSDGIIGKVEDGKITMWKEYLDGRVSRMQKLDALPLEEGEEPFPSPNGSLRTFCSIACTQ